MCTVVRDLDRFGALSAYSVEASQKLLDQSGTLPNAGEFIEVVSVAAWAGEGVGDLEPLTTAVSAHAHETHT